MKVMSLSVPPMVILEHHLAPVGEGIPIGTTIDYATAGHSVRAVATLSEYHNSGSLTDLKIEVNDNGTDCPHIRLYSIALK